MDGGGPYPYTGRDSQPWFDVKKYGAAGNGSTDDSTAIQAAIAAAETAGRGVVYFPAGVYLIGTGLIVTNRSLQLIGAGKAETTITYTGNGSAIQAGDATAGSVDGLRLEGFTVSGTGSGARGIDLRRFNGFRIDEVRVTGFSAGSGIRFNGSNSGFLTNVNCDLCAIGAEYAVDGAYNPNLIIWKGGQIVANTKAVQAAGPCSGNELDGLNIASTTASPAINIASGVGWKIKGCYFENNKGGASTTIISLGVAATFSSNGTLIEGNYFTEANSPTYFIQIVQGVANLIIGNYIAAAPATAFVRCDTNAQLTNIWGNIDPTAAVTILSDGSGTVDQFLMGESTTFTKDAYGYVFGADLAGTASRALSSRTKGGSVAIHQFRDSGGTVVSEVGTSGVFNDRGAACITAASGTGITVNATGNLRRTVYKVTLSQAAFAAAALTADATIATLPAKTRLVGVYADVTQVFSGGAVSAATMILGKTVGGNEYLLSFDIKTATIRKGLLDADLGASLTRANRVQDADLPSFTGTTTVSARLTTVTANTNALTQGSVTFYLICETLP